MISTLALRGLGASLTVLLTLSVTRYLQVNAAAEFLFIVNVTTVAAVCFRWGFDDLIVRRVAADDGHTPRLIPYLIALSHRRVATWAVISLVVVAFLGLTGADVALGTDLVKLFAVVMISGFIALIGCAGRAYQGRGRTNYAVLVLSVSVPGGLLIGLWMLVGLSVRADSWRLLMIYTAVSLLVYLGTVWAQKSTRPDCLGPDDNRQSAAKVALDRRAANSFGAVVLCQYALHWSALVVVPVAYGDLIFTSFMVTYKVALLIDIVMMAINFTFAARLAALFAASKFEELKRLVRAMLIVVAVASTVAAGLVFCCRGLVYAFADVQGSDGVLTVLVLAQIFFTMSAVYALVLSMCHGEAFLLKAQGAVVISGVVVFVVLSFTNPLEYSVVAFAVTYLALTIILRRRARQVMNHQITS